MQGSHSQRPEADEDQDRPGQEGPEEQRIKRRRHRRWLTGIAVGVGAVLIAGGLIQLEQTRSSSMRVLGDQKFALPAENSGCGGVISLSGGAFVVPIKVSSVGSAVEALVELCLEGQGPFPFVVDTGASSSAIVLSLARHLHLSMLELPQRYAGVGCTGTAQFEELTAWSMAGLPLAGQAITAQTIPGWGRQGEPVGLLGADILSRFGAVRFDFAAQTMTLPGTEGPARNGPNLVTGPLASPIPSDLISGPPSSLSGLSVIEGPNYAVATTTVHFRDADRYEVFELDTGASRSVVRTSLARKMGLVNTAFRTEIQTSCSKTTVPLVQSGPWSINRVRLAPTMLRSTDLGQLRPAEINGLLGLDELSRFQYAIIDFTGATLALGPALH